jgi:predicted XRE-type DNA-binding protein
MKNAVHVVKEIQKNHTIVLIKLNFTIVIRNVIVVMNVDTNVVCQSNMKVITLDKEFNPKALKLAMGYRGISQTKLCKNINGLSQPNLSRFLNGYIHVISKEKLQEIMIYLDWPFDFLRVKSIK